MKLKQSDILKHLHERIAKGEHAKDILQIKDTYYVDKVVNGYVEISAVLFDRIMSDVFTQEERIQAIVDSNLERYTLLF